MVIPGEVDVLSAMPFGMNSVRAATAVSRNFFTQRVRDSKAATRAKSLLSVSNTCKHIGEKKNKWLLRVKWGFPIKKFRV